MDIGHNLIMKILIVGGHMAPALAFLQHLPESADIVYVGRKHPFEGDTGLSLEYQTLTDLGIRFVPLQTGRLQRRLTLHTIPSLLKIPTGVKQAREILQKEKPDIVVGFGGYLSLSVGAAAWTLKIPLVIHEQTMRAGLANKILSKIATKIAISWETSQRYFPKNKTELVGNLHLHGRPSEQIKHLISETASLPRIVVTGGSAGSHAVNMLIEKILPQLLEKYEVIHQTGDAQEFGDYDHLLNIQRALPKELQERYYPRKFIHPSDFDYLYEHAHLVITRSGINTVTTLLLKNVPSILIPLQSGQKNEQLQNAKFLEKSGIAEIFLQNHSSDALRLMIDDMMERRNEYRLSKEAEGLKARIESAATTFVELVYVISQVSSQTKS